MGDLRTPAAPAQLDPRLLAEGEPWRCKCPLCPLTCQGGLLGLQAHMDTVHAVRARQAD